MISEGGHTSGNTKRKETFDHRLFSTVHTTGSLQKKHPWNWTGRVAGSSSFFPLKQTPSVAKEELNTFAIITSL